MEVVSVFHSLLPEELMEWMHSFDSFSYLVQRAKEAEMALPVARKHRAAAEVV